MPDEQTQQQLLDLIEAVKDDYGRVDLSSMWRPYSRYLLSHNTGCSNVHRQPTLSSADSVEAFCAWGQNSSCNMQAWLIMSVIACGGVLETRQRLL